ncbi:hypothetical protein ASG35_27200 [Burkholderia sp. Leaf177]|nr:hypothetical protein ASG35_27200 [Burkholderia sp. Leaf177]
MVYEALKLIHNGAFVAVYSSADRPLPVTSWLTEQGWRGVSIDAAASPAKSSIVPADGAGPSGRTYNVVGDPDVEAFSRTHSLSAILDTAFKGDIHFLSVDASDLGQQALADIDLSVRRPWIVLIYQPDGNGSIEQMVEWKAAMKKSDYTTLFESPSHCLYVAAEHAEFVLQGRFGEDFGRASQASGVGGPSTHLATADGATQDLSNPARSEVSKAMQHAVRHGDEIEVELRLARIERAHLQSRMETAEAWARSSAEWIKDAETRAERAERRANSSSSWINRLELRLRGVSSTLAQTEREIASLRDRLEHSDLDRASQASTITALEGSLEASERARNELEQRMSAILSSTSWRLAAPLRYILGPFGLRIRRWVPSAFRRRPDPDTQPVPEFPEARASAADPVQPSPGHESVAPAPSSTTVPVLQPQRVRMYADMLKNGREPTTSEQA